MPASSKPNGRPDEQAVDNGTIHRITSQVEKWRYKCPNEGNHNDWRLWNSVFNCQTCQQLRNAGERDVDPVFEQLWDSKEEQLVPRECIRLEMETEW